MTHHRSSQPHRCKQVIVGSRLLLGIYIPSINQHFLSFSKHHVLIHHHCHQLLEPNLRCPPQQLLCLAGIPLQIVHLSRSKVSRVNLHVVLPIHPHVSKRSLQELLDSMGLFRGHHVVVRGLLLKHQPHGLHVISRKPPISGSLKVAKKQLFLEPHLDPTHCSRYLTGHKVLPPTRRLMVEENTVTRKHPIGFPIVHSVPMGCTFGRGIGRPRMERGIFRLWRRS